MSKDIKNERQNLKFIKVRVYPKSSLKKIVIEKVDEEEIFKVYITEVPENGKANASVIKLLSTHFKIPKSSIAIKSGSHGRDKLVCIQI